MQINRPDAGFRNRVAAWLPGHPEAYVMADRTLHQAECPFIADLDFVDVIAGVHHQRLPLTLRAETLWGTWSPCWVCLPDGDERRAEDHPDELDVAAS